MIFANIRWFTSPALWLALMIFYLLSPRALTIDVLAYVRPREFRADVRDVMHARFVHAGDVQACLLLDIKSNGVVELYQVELPVAMATSKDNPEVQKRIITPIVNRFDLLSFDVDETRIQPGCSAQPEKLDIYTGENKVFDGYGDGRPQEPAYLAELYIDDSYSSRLVYINREPLRHVRYARVGTLPEESVDEYHVAFIFPRHKTGVRWWYMILLPPAVLIDAIAMPLEWYLLLSQEGPIKW